MVSPTQLRRLGEQINELEERVLPEKRKVMRRVVMPDWLEEQDVLAAHKDIYPDDHDADFLCVVILSWPDFLKPPPPRTNPFEVSAAWNDEAFGVVARAEEAKYAADELHLIRVRRVIKKRVEGFAKDKRGGGSIGWNIGCLRKWWGLDADKAITMAGEYGAPINDPEFLSQVREPSQ